MLSTKPVWFAEKNGPRTSWFPTWGPVPRHDACANEWIDGMLLGSNGPTFFWEGITWANHPQFMWVLVGGLSPQNARFWNCSNLPQNDWTQLGGDVSKSHPKKGGDLKFIETGRVLSIELRCDLHGCEVQASSFW